MPKLLDQYPILKRANPELQSYLVASAAFLESIDPEHAPLEFLRNGYNSSQPPAPSLEVGKVLEGTIPGAVGELPVRHYIPKGEGPFPIIVHFHGGGFFAGDFDSHDGQCRNLCRESNSIVSHVLYRLAPEHKIPAAHEDAFAALQYISANAAMIGGDPSRLGVAGDSAGGNLSAYVSIRSNQEGGPKIKAQLIAVPATGERPEDDMLKRDNPAFSVASYERLGKLALSNPEERNHERIDLRSTGIEDLQGLPPTVLLVAEIDILYDQGMAFGSLLESAGVPVQKIIAEGQVHGVFSMPHMVRSAKQYCDQAAHAMKRLLND